MAIGSLLPTAGAGLEVPAALLVTYRIRYGWSVPVSSVGATLALLIV